MKAIRSALLGIVLAGVATVASAQNEQFIPMAGYWVGAYAAGGSGIYGGFIDYVNMINARDGGVKRVNAQRLRGVGQQAPHHDGARGD